MTNFNIQGLKDLTATCYAVLLLVLSPLAGMGDYLNPCGIIEGQDAWFRIGFGGVSPPDSEIEWIQSGEGLVSFPDGNHGKTVRVRGETCGDVKLEIQIGDACSMRPCFPAKVVTNSVVGVSVWVISDGMTPACSSGSVAEKLNRAGIIWRQAGISFRLDEYLVTNRADMLDVGYTSSNGAPTIYDVAALNPVTGGIKVYFVNKINGIAGSYAVTAATLRQGIVVSTNATVTTLAHEIGHALGLKDIYFAYQGISRSANGPVIEAMMPDDWNGGSGQRYYSSGTRIENLIPQLLMYGGSGDERADITIGGVYGLWYSNRWNAAAHRFERVWQTSLAPIGFFRDGSNVPQYGNEEYRGGEMLKKAAVFAAITGMGLRVSAETIPPYIDEIGLSPEICVNAPECEKICSISDEEAIKAIASIIKYEHDMGIAANVFKRMGEDRERMTRVLLRSVEDAGTRQYKDWSRVAQYSIGCLSEYGTETAMPFLESVLTNDVYGAGWEAANAYVRLVGDSGRDFEFFKKNFGVGKYVPRNVGRVVYWTLKTHLDGRSLSEDKRREYLDYLMSRAECEKDILTGHMLDNILVEMVPGYRDGEKRKANLEIIAKPDPNPNQPHIVFRRGSPAAIVPDKDATK